MKVKTDESASHDVADGLRTVLADTYALFFKTENCHWNVEGPEFPFLHKLFEKQYQELLEAADTVAERIRALGMYVPGRYEDLIQGTSIREEAEVLDSQRMIQKLLEGHSLTAETIRVVIPMAQKQGDEATVNLLGERLLAHEKSAWMLSSCLKKGEKATELPLKRMA